MLLFPCDDVIYINHSCNANTLGTRFGFDVAVRDIREGEEITYDYRMFYENKWRSADYYGDFACLCGEPDCVKVIRFIGPEYQPSAKLVMDWKKRISSSLRRILKVEQPLWGELLKCNNEYIVRLNVRKRKTA